MDAMATMERLMDQEYLICTTLCLLATSVLLLRILLVHQLNDWSQKIPSRWLEDMGWAIITGSVLALMATAVHSLLQ